MAGLFKDVANLPLVPDGVGDQIAAYLATDAAIVGTPEDAIARIELLQRESGGFWRVPAVCAKLGEQRRDQTKATS